MEISKLLMRDTLPKKDLLNASEIAAMLKVEQTAIYLWETQFPQIRSRKFAHGIRMYDQDAVLLFSAIKHLLLEKKLSIPLALKNITESDTLSARYQKEAQSMTLPSLEVESLLKDSSQMLPEEDAGFDEKTHEIYQEVKGSLEEEIVIAPDAAFLMLADALVLHSNEQAANKRKDYHEELASLLARKESLSDLLDSLNKFEQASIPVAIKD